MSRTSTGSSSPRDAGGAVVPSSHAETAAALDRLGIRPSRALGQSFLADPFIADAESALLDGDVSGPVVEIGGGLGVLTRALLRRGVRDLTVVERDPRLAEHLTRAFGPAVRVREADALAVDFSGVRTVVGNLPFSRASEILLRLFESGVGRIVVLVQREVAERLAAAPGGRAYGRLTLAARWYGTAETFAVVPSRAFYPTPKVSGQLVRLVRRDGPGPDVDRRRFDRVVSTLFRHRRKQLKNLVPALADPGDARALARAAGWPDDWERRRPEELDFEQFVALARAWAGDRDK